LSRLYVDWGGMEDIRRDYGKELINDSLAMGYDAKNADALGALAHAYALNGKMQQSINKFNELAKSYQGNKDALTDIYGSIAEQEYFLGRYDKVIEASNAALAANPHAFVLYIIRGRAYLKKSNNDLATADFNKILALDTDRHSSSYALALFFTGKQEQAVGIMQSAATTTPNKLIRLTHYYQLARAYALMNKPDEANTYLKKSIEGGYSPKYAFADPDLENIRNTQDFKDMTAGK
ncbi:MAG: tetratricopeptide repeat protein, partial [Mucilaginibacter sp.]